MRQWHYQNYVSEITTPGTMLIIDSWKVQLCNIHPFLFFIFGAHMLLFCESLTSDSTKFELVLWILNLFVNIKMKNSGETEDFISVFSNFLTELIKNV